MNYRIAVPSKAGMPVFDLHECGEVSIVDVDAGRIQRIQTASVDPKDEELLPRQLEDMGVDVLIAGGIGPGTLDRLNRSHLNLVTGARGEKVEELVNAFLDGSLSIPSYTDGRRPVE
jgi:predicted Fe-Mo cluster-binding NifX family protein